ncbi:MAG TPA: hypothetical protein PLW79_04855 [Caldisericia bacterium]|nr:hypothetical protein [Caldisericia bacterium]HOL83025.1 hypothetical protein [Caldisericia bacterium]HPP43754.1 hypothetical protein [Caldisericia bacterium]
MKFSEIKDKIKNNRGFNSLKEIKERGLRIIRNTKTGDYWLIEEEFLKPVIKSPRECKSIIIKPEDLKYKVIMCHKSKDELKNENAFILDYIEWGEKEGFNNRPTCKSRKYWWDLGQKIIATNFMQLIIGDRFISVINTNNILADTEYYIVNFNWDKSILGLILNSTLTRLFLELLGRNMIGAITGLKLQVYEIANLNILSPLIFENKKNSIEKNINKISIRDIKNIFIEIGFDPDKPIREQVSNPLPDRKELDDIVFDIIGLTEDERKEVYWAVAELVQNRLKKAKSV